MKRAARLVEQFVSKNLLSASIHFYMRSSSLYYSHCLSKEDQKVFIAIPNTKGQRVMSHKRAKKSDSEVIHSFGQEKLASIVDDAGGKFEREKK